MAEILTESSAATPLMPSSSLQPWFDDGIGLTGRFEVMRNYEDTGPRASSWPPTSTSQKRPSFTRRVVMPSCTGERMAIGSSMLSNSTAKASQAGSAPTDELDQA